MVIRTATRWLNAPGRIVGLKRTITDAVSPAAIARVSYSVLVQLHRAPALMMLTGSADVFSKTKRCATIPSSSLMTPKSYTVPLQRNVSFASTGMLVDTMHEDKSSAAVYFWVKCGIFCLLNFSFYGVTRNSRFAGSRCGSFLPGADCMAALEFSVPEKPATQISYKCFQS